VVVNVSASESSGKLLGYIEYRMPNLEAFTSLPATVEVFDTSAPNVSTQLVVEVSSSVRTDSVRRREKAVVVMFEARSVPSKSFTLHIPTLELAGGKTTPETVSFERVTKIAWQALCM
jgi:hypothetical protein